MADWNKVFVPYCTGDVYAGTVVNTYEDPDGIESDSVIRHVGHDNILAMTEMLNEMFSTVPKLFVGGCSAGGAGAIVNYYFLRTGIEGVQRGYLLNDSGPLYPDQADTSRSLLLHDDGADRRGAATGSSTTHRSPSGSATTWARSMPFWPRSSQTIAWHRRSSRLDYNFSLYSYERFWTSGSSDSLDSVLGRRARLGPRPLHQSHGDPQPMVGRYRSSARPV